MRRTLGLLEGAHTGGPGLLADDLPPSLARLALTQRMGSRPGSRAAAATPPAVTPQTAQPTFGARVGNALGEFFASPSGNMGGLEEAEMRRRAIMQAGLAMMANSRSGVGEPAPLF